MCVVFFVWLVGCQIDCLFVCVSLLCVCLLFVCVPGICLFLCCVWVSACFVVWLFVWLVCAVVVVISCELSSETRRGNWEVTTY